MSATNTATRVIYNNVAKMQSEPGTVQDSGVWPYVNNFFPNTRSSEFSCAGCRINANDAIGRSGGYAPDGAVSGNTNSYAHDIVVGYEYFGSANFTNAYLQKLTCIPGPWSDAGETEVATYRAYLWDPVANTNYPVSADLTFTEGTDTVGVPKSAQININTEYFIDSGATLRGFRPFGFGVMLSSETDATDNNLSNIRCSVEWSVLGNE